MPRLDVHRMPGGSAGYVVVVQAGLLEHLATRVVVPLMPAAASPPPIRDLNPCFAIEGVEHVFLSQAIATVPTRELRAPVASLLPHHDAITRALDVLLLDL